jgi:hypothetical protein
VLYFIGVLLDSTSPFFLLFGLSLSNTRSEQRFHINNLAWWAV